MSTRKREYIIEVNEIDGDSQYTFEYTYGQTKGILLELFAKGTRTTMLLGSSKSAVEFASTSHAYFSDALYKALMAYTLCNDAICNLSVVRVRVGVDKELDEYEAFNAASGKIACPFLPAIDYSQKLNLSSYYHCKAVMDSVLNTPKTNNDVRMAALTALIISKAKSSGSWVTDCSERFMYLWMSMNGYYSFINKQFSKPSQKDSIAIMRCLKVHRLGNRAVSQNDHAEFAKLAAKAIRNLEGESLEEVLEKDTLPEELNDLLYALRSFEIRESNKSKHPYETLSLKGYLTLCLPYHYRCTYIHSNRPLPLFVHGKDERYLCMSALCGMMDSFLNSNLWKLFDNAFVKDKLAKRIDEIERNQNN